MWRLGRRGHYSGRDLSGFDRHRDLVSTPCSVSAGRWVVSSCISYTTYVVGDAGTTYDNAYFAFNYINVFSTSNSTSSSSSSSSSSSGADRRTSLPVWLAVSTLLFGAVLSWTV